jgi:hypothetical protein
VNSFEEHTPRILINRENLMEKQEIQKFLNYKESFVILVGDSDKMIEEIVTGLGWSDDLNKLL